MAQEHLEIEDHPQPVVVVLAAADVLVLQFLQRLAPEQAALDAAALVDHALHQAGQRPLQPFCERKSESLLRPVHDRPRQVTPRHFAGDVLQAAALQFEFGRNTHREFGDTAVQERAA